MKETAQKKFPVGWVVVGIVIGIIVVATFVILFSSPNSPLYRIMNPPKPEVTMVQGYDTLQGLDIVFIVDTI